MDSSTQQHHVADAEPGNWVEKYLPPAALPYAQLMRLDRPIGWWLLLLPCWWGLALAVGRSTPQWLHLWHAFLFFAGAVVMRGAGCVLNDIFDRHIDAQVARTRSRPLPSGRVSLRPAVVFLFVLLMIGLVVLLQFNRQTIIIGLLSLLIVAFYPVMKRITYWPQLMLGIAFNWGALLGWTAVAGQLDAPALVLYAAGILWTLAYDTIYAHQDKLDDALIGVKSTALKFGEKTQFWLQAFFGGALALIAVSFWLVPVHPIAFVGLIAAAAHAAWQLQKFNGNDADLCLKLFKSNRTFGLLVLAGLILDIVVQ
jgi:4-hydroxybenzoate polyprenyltransferase